MRWIEALREYNAKHNPGKWCIPRKGTEEMAKVRAIMGASAPKAAAEPKAKGPKVRAAVKKIEETMSDLDKEELETMKALEEKSKARAAPKKKTIGEMRAVKKAAKAPAAPKKTIGEMRAEKKAASPIEEKLETKAKERGYRYKRFDELQVGDRILRKTNDGEEVALLVEMKTPLTATVSGKMVEPYKMKSSKKILYKVLV